MIDNDSARKMFFMVPSLSVGLLLAAGELLDLRRTPLSDGISSSVQAGRCGSLKVVLLLVLRGWFGVGLLLRLIVLFLFASRSDAANDGSASGSRRSIAPGCAGEDGAMCCAFCHVVVVATALFVLCFGRRRSSIRVIAGLGFRAVVALLLVG